MLMQLDAHALTCYDDRAYAKVIKRYHECVLKAYLLMCLYVRMLCWSNAHMSTYSDDHMLTCLLALMITCSNVHML